MKKSKIFSLALASVLSASAVTSLASNALFFGRQKDSDFLKNVDEYFSDSEKYFDVTDYKCLLDGVNGMNDDDVIAHYALIDSHLSYRFIDNPDSINFTCSSDMDMDLIEDIIKGVDDSLQLSAGFINSITRVDKDGNYIEIPVEMAREIYGLLEEYVTRFDYYYDMYSVDHLGHDYPTKYFIEDSSVLEECIKRNNIDAEIVQFESSKEAYERLGTDFYETDCFYVVPNKKLSFKEHLDLAELIYEDTGMYSEYFIFEDATAPIGKAIDMYNAVDGDANCDGELSIADATLILQHLGNADKYGLSAQGKFNADVTGDYDGISAADALAIQMFETGVIDELG